MINLFKNALQQSITDGISTWLRADRGLHRPQAVSLRNPFENYLMNKFTIFFEKKNFEKEPEGLRGRFYKRKAIRVESNETVREKYEDRASVEVHKKIRLKTEF